MNVDYLDHNILEYLDSGSVLAIGLIGQLDQLDIGLIGLVPINPNNQLNNWT